MNQLPTDIVAVVVYELEEEVRYLLWWVHVWNAVEKTEREWANWEWPEERWERDVVVRGRTLDADDIADALEHTYFTVYRYGSDVVQHMVRDVLIASNASPEIRATAGRAFRELPFHPDLNHTDRFAARFLHTFPDTLTLVAKERGTEWLTVVEKGCEYLLRHMTPSTASPIARTLLFFMQSFDNLVHADCTTFPPTLLQFGWETSTLRCFLFVLAVFGDEPVSPPLSLDVETFVFSPATPQTPQGTLYVWVQTSVPHDRWDRLERVCEREGWAMRPEVAHCYDATPTPCLVYMQPITLDYDSDTTEWE